MEEGRQIAFLFLLKPGKTFVFNGTCPLSLEVFLIFQPVPNDTFGRVGSFCSSAEPAEVSRQNEQGI